MWLVLDRIPFIVLIAAAVFMGFAPFVPMPHLLEKLIMLKDGSLTRPVDIFDLFFHLFPILILILKVYRYLSKSK